MVLVRRSANLKFLVWEIFIVVVFCQDFVRGYGLCFGCWFGCRRRGGLDRQSILFLSSGPFLEPGADAGEEQDDQLPKRGGEFCDHGEDVL